MSVTIHLSCCGCDATAEGTAPIRRQWVSISGGNLHKVQQVPPTITDLAPEGWVMFDPYTLVTYCPKCWAEIESGETS